MSCHQLVLQTAVNIPAFVRIVASDLQVESFDFAIFELDFIRHKSTAKFPAAPGPGRKRFAQIDYLQASQVILRFVVKRITGSRFPLNDEAKNYLGGLQVINLGKPFSAWTRGGGKFGGAFVPYKIQFKNGEVKRFHLQVRCDNPDKRWYVDGGL